MYYLGSKVKIHDIETFPNAFIYCDIDTKDDKINIFVIHQDRNDIKEFISYLSQLKGLIGYNNLGFDSQVIHYIILSWVSGEWEYFSTSEITDLIFKFAQSVINKGGLRTFLTYAEKVLRPPHLDLMKIHHFDNVARIQSLKGLQCNLNYHKVQESPVSFKAYITKEQLEEAIGYCINDIESTKVFFIKSESKINLRRKLIEEYNLPIYCFNWSDSKIGEQLMLLFYCEATDKDLWKTKKLRTIRESVNLKDCIPENVKFITGEFNSIKNIFENTTIYYEHNFRMKKSSVNYKGLQYDFGVGGIHASLTGVFESNDDYIILDVDVGSMYPSIAISNNYYPEHLGPEFVKVYKEKIVDVRLKEKRKPKAERNQAIIDGFKLAANSVYGKSNDRFSFLYDPFYTFSTTITGQLQLSMLVENICENIDDVQVIQANTDGITVRLNRNYIEKFRDICKEWEKTTKLTLEEVEYKKMYIRDVNNYCAVTSEYAKLKGCFEKDKDLHKDPSARIVPIALEKYIVDGTPVEETIINHEEIWDFLLRVKFKKNMRGEYHWIEKGKHRIEEAEKVARFYVANKGKTFKKNYLRDGVVYKDEAIQKGWLCLDANLIEETKASHYDINHKYYIKECYKIIEAVEQNRSQLTLF